MSLNEYRRERVILSSIPKSRSDIKKQSKTGVRTTYIIGFCVIA